MFTTVVRERHTQILRVAQHFIAVGIEPVQGVDVFGPSSPPALAGLMIGVHRPARLYIRLGRGDQFASQMCPADGVSDVEASIRPPEISYQHRLRGQGAKHPGGVHGFGPTLGRDRVPGQCVGAGRMHPGQGTIEADPGPIGADETAAASASLSA